MNVEAQNKFPRENQSVGNEGRRQSDHYKCKGVLNVQNMSYKNHFVRTQSNFPISNKKNLLWPKKKSFVSAECASLQNCEFLFSHALKVFISPAILTCRFHCTFAVHLTTPGLPTHSHTHKYTKQVSKVNNLQFVY